LTDDRFLADEAYGKVLTFELGLLLFFVAEPRLGRGEPSANLPKAFILFGQNLHNHLQLGLMLFFILRKGLL